MTSQPVASYQAVTLRTYSGREAQQLAASPEFQSQWRLLAGRCPWSTALQTPEFACTWYDCYADLYRPLILARYTSGGEMDGLMALAVERATGKLTCAGAHQAEYHVWLALPGEQSFIGEALEQLRKLGFSSLTFTYLPPGTPLDWLESRWAGWTALRTVPRPLLAVDNVEAISDSLNKKKNRRRLEKLQENGALTFLQLRTPEELDVYYDQIIDFYDFRMGAIHGHCPFREDPGKRVFYRALIAQNGLLHVTVMKVGDRLIAAHIGVQNKQEVTLGIVSHSPFVAIHSPGKLHILQLGLLLHEQGLTSLDLTPGGDAYKDDRATRYDDAHVLTVFLDRKSLVRHNAVSRLRSLAKTVLGALKIDKHQLGNWSLIRRQDSPLRPKLSAIDSVRRWIWSSTELRFYRADVKARGAAPASADVRRDSLVDLMCYEPYEESGYSRQQFLQNALVKIELGAHPYSLVRDHKLIVYGCLTTKIDKSALVELCPTYEFPPKSALIRDFYVHPSYRDQKLCLTLLEQLLRDAAATDGIDFLYVTVSAGNGQLRSVLAEAGFQYQNSVYSGVRFGVGKHRISSELAQ
jgi:CelD/BcsL family acetyltransferase involved in cellulose biosynthesis